MANAAGMVKESIWRDPDWRKLPRSAQATYAQLLSQKELDRAGMLPLQVSKWAKGCDEVTEGSFWDDLKLLEARRFVFVDEDTDELFVRSYMRHSEVPKYPQYLKAAIRCAGMVASEKLRHELAVELRRLRLADAAKLADEIDPGETVLEPFTDRSATVPEPLENPSRTVNPSGTLREPWGVGEGVGVVTSVGGYVGGTRAREDEPAPGEAQQLGDEPPRFCPRHMPDGPPPGVNCGGCADARRVHRDWLAEQSRIASDAARERAIAERDQRRAEALANQSGIADCPFNCFERDGYTPAGVVCDHQPHASPETRAEVMAQVAALRRKPEPDDDSGPVF